MYIDSTSKDIKDKLNLRGEKLIISAMANEKRTLLENFWYGYIDEVRLWNTRLADSTISFQSIHSEKLGVYYRYSYYDSLIGLWRFNLVTPNTTIEDESDFDNEGTIYTL